MYTSARYPETPLAINREIGVKCIETAKRVIAFVEQRLEEKA